jgi:hypothetical protein
MGSHVEQFRLLTFYILSTGVKNFSVQCSYYKYVITVQKCKKDVILLHSYRRYSA